jgi:hypothetical protein
MATPSLAMIPSGYKAQKVYSVLPTNGDGDFTFARSGSATRVNESGLIETVGNNVPRLDYSNGGCPSLLLEPERTNLITYSEDFSQSDWSIFDVSKSANSVVSPDGTLNGARITALSGTNRVFQQLVTVSADPINNRVFTGSIYIKSSSVTSCFLRVGLATSNNAITISNEWQRFEAQYTLGATFTAVRLGIVLNNEGDEVDVAFGQVEQGIYAASYIPTSGSAATRITDELPLIELRSKNILGSSYFSYLFDFTHQGGGTFSGFFNEVDNASNYKGGWVESDGLKYRTLIGGGNFYVNVKVPITSGDRVKCCVTLNGSTRKIYANGVLISTLNNCDNLSNDIDGFIQYYGNTQANYESFKYNGLRVYNTELTEAEAIALTTI